MLKLTTDISDALKGLDRLVDPALRESLARRMSVSGGAVMRDEAKSRAPVASEPAASNQYPVKRGKGGRVLGQVRGASGTRPGELRDAIYLAYRDKASTKTVVVYGVTWNAKKAPHGHLAEFGHRIYWRVARNNHGKYYTTTERLSQPKIVAGKGFLAGTYEAALQRTQQAMIDRARKELPELLKGVNNGA